MRPLSYIEVNSLPKGIYLESRRARINPRCWLQSLAFWCYPVDFNNRDKTLWTTLKGRHRGNRSFQIAINTVKAVQNSMKEKRAERTFYMLRSTQFITKTRFTWISWIPPILKSQCWFSFKSYWIKYKIYTQKSAHYPATTTWFNRKILCITSKNISTLLDISVSRT